MSGPRVAPSSPWWHTAVIACLLLLPFAFVQFMDRPGEDRVAVAGLLSLLLANLVLLCAALVLALDARLTDCPLRASMATAAALVAVQDAPIAVAAMVDPSLGAHTHRLTITHLGVVVVVLAVIVAGRRGTSPRRLNPLLSGFLLSVPILATSVVVHEIGSVSLVLHPDRLGDRAVIALIAATLAAIWIQLRQSTLPRWVVDRIGLGVLAVFAARLGSTLGDASGPPPLSVVGTVAFSALVVTSALSLLRHSMNDSAATSRSYAVRAAVAEAAVRHDQAVAHEVRATTAGIVAGAQLLASGQVPPGPRRSALEHMVDAEAARLGRSLAPRSSPPTTVEVDEVVAPLLVAQAALGHDVSWEPQGHVVNARHDDLAEVINVLLNNAARHGLRRGTRIESREVGERVEIRVSDRGPGIAPDLGDRLFEWGTRGPHSVGEGIGLQSARRLLHQYGGQLVVERSIPDVSTVFLARLRWGRGVVADGDAPAPVVGLAQ